MNRTWSPFVALVLVVSVFLLGACGGDQLVYRVTGTVNQAEVTYTDGDGASQNETVTLPWEISLKAGGGEFSLVAQNATAQGNIRCAVLLGEKELGHAEAEQYASCEGSFEKMAVA